MKTTSKCIVFTAIGCLSVAALVLAADPPAALLTPDAAVDKHDKGKQVDALAAASTENARQVAARIKSKAALGNLAKEVRIVSAIYDLNTGKIEWIKD